MSEQEKAPLSRQERVVVILLCAGLTNREIATQVGMAEPAVAQRVSRILRRLGLRNRAQLAVWAVKQGLY